MEFKSDEKKTWLEDKNGKQIALLDHPEVKPGVVNLLHTEVGPSLGGQGIAGKITQAVAERLREKGLKAELSCSYSIRWFSKHPEYAVMCWKIPRRKNRRQKCWLALRAG